MKEVKLRVDWYTKFILTVIAFALLGLLFKPLFIPQKAEAEKEITDVNIAKINGWAINSPLVSPIPVKIAKNY